MLNPILGPVLTSRQFWWRMAVTLATFLLVTGAFVALAVVTNSNAYMG